MLPETEALLRSPDSELVFGLVAPVGADLDTFEADLSTQLRRYGYEPKVIRLSALLKQVQDPEIRLRETPEFIRLKSYMDAGNRLRERSGSEILALWAIAEIKSRRNEEKPVSPRF